MRFSAIVTAYRRQEQILFTLRKLTECKPPPAEILVHVDGNQLATKEIIRCSFPLVKVLLSEDSVGPGGGRNKLIEMAENEVIASFDDDSYPIDSDYFSRISDLFNRFPDADILCSRVYHQGEVIGPALQTAVWASDFSGGGCVYRRRAFAKTGGYVPITVAYGMEEVDLAIRLHAQGGKILMTPWLRVFHDTDLGRHSKPEVTAGSIANIALLTHLRYPPSCWWIGAAQCIRRIWWLVGHGRSRGVLQGLLMIPDHIRAYHRYQGRLPAVVIRSYLALRRNPVKAEFDRQPTGC